MAYYHMGVIHERRGEKEDAARSFQRAIDELVGEVSSLYHLALLRSEAGDDDAAADLLERTREFARANGVATQEKS